ncbi:hypothetical protein BOSEA31B_20090 [Hyphomicrobiales bacterium]|nr:hypothetical protein BOSEA31B_20090 [Hyphomicrobiales bacterium]CAH1702539.1 hypothetical protein BOSEA1005_30411 [Hyphomicrobiales bacterium]CAI0346742.1 hypothetical protein BO1005MUT1_520254 [Hyphomicrobiales bacterium]
MNWLIQSDRDGAAGASHPRLYHFGATVITHVRSRPQIDVPFFKPAGFWVSVGDSWLRLVRASSHLADFSLAKSTEVSVVASQLIWLRNFEEIVDFERRFRTEWSHAGVSHTSIGWDKVAAAADGVVITDLDFDKLYRTRELHWAISWECASGCIWNSLAVTRLTEIVNASPLDPL